MSTRNPLNIYATGVQRLQGGTPLGEVLRLLKIQARHYAQHYDNAGGIGSFYADNLTRLANGQPVDSSLAGITRRAIAAKKPKTEPTMTDADKLTTGANIAQPGADLPQPKAVNLPRQTSTAKTVRFTEDGTPVPGGGGNWKAWALGALVVGGLVWWFFFRGKSAAP